MERYRPIGAYGVIGNCRSAALVSDEGSIDWLCLPRMDSGSLFAAILDSEHGGRFAVRPRNVRRVQRRYLGRSNVLETTFHCDGGAMVLTDAMTICNEAAKRKAAYPDMELLRIARCSEGEVEVEVTFQPRPRWGEGRFSIRDCKEIGWDFDAGPQSGLLRSEIPLEKSGIPWRLDGCCAMAAGQRKMLALTHCLQEPNVSPLLGDAAEQRMQATIAWWEGWAGHANYQGPYAEQVMRSALALKLLCYPPSGAVLAAATTSLPEAIGGDRNWDYRYCWLRDASFTMRALLSLGYHLEAEAYFSWLLYTTRLTAPKLSVLYNVYGEESLPERIVPLEGYRSSAPVRIGNGAFNQRQLDVYGAVLDAAWKFALTKGKIDRKGGRMLRAFAQEAARLWTSPDAGIWESRSGAEHHTLSKVMCWVAVDRLLKMHAKGWLKAPQERLERVRREIEERVEQCGWSDQRQSYVATFEGRQLDAALLLLSLYEYQPGDSKRMVATIDAVIDELGVDGSLYRYKYEDGWRSREGAFGICGFWAVEALVRAGRIEEGKERFEHLLTLSNDLGLYSEETDTADGGLLGNLPQAFTHVGLIDAAIMLKDAEEGRLP